VGKNVCRKNNKMYQMYIQFAFKITSKITANETKKIRKNTLKSLKSQSKKNVNCSANSIHVGG